MSEEDLFEEYERNYIKEHTTSIKCYTEESYNKLQQENKQLKELCNKYEEEHKTTFESWIKGQKVLIELEEWLNECLEKGDKHKFIVIRVKDVLDKIQKLKEKYK